MSDFEGDLRILREAAKLLERHIIETWRTRPEVRGEYIDRCCGHCGTLTGGQGRVRTFKGTDS